MKRTIACLLLLTMIAALPARAEHVSLPPQDEQILGDKSMVQTRDVTLYYADENESELGSVTRRIIVDENGSLIESVLDELERLSACNVVSSDLSCGVATVDLSAETAANLSRSEIYRMCVSMADTLLGLEEVEAVNILIGGEGCEVYNLPQGVFTEQITSVSAAYAQILAETESYTEQGGTITRNILLYFPSESDNRFLPEVRSISFDKDNVLSAILNALMDGPALRMCCYSPIPSGIDYLLELPTVSVNGSGERQITLNFSTTLTDYLAFAGIEASQLYGSIALTLLSFYPETASVRILVDGAPAANITDGMSDGTVNRCDYSAMIGSSATLFCANGNGRLSAVEVPMSQSYAASALHILREMVSMDVPDDDGLRSVFPDGIVPEDILGVSLDGRVATVNLSAAFYAHCQNLSNAEEQLLIYAMVNALCELEQIGAVGFRIEGEQFEYLSGEIYMKSSLLPDPGLVSDSKTNTEE